ncbi:Sigma-E factor regulatory protein rseB precursor [Anaerobiospirillum thomasii]|uniref:sigma-E factor regulatory protein RseB domain-containing protein n=1 Tax=Anaerobiospirillum thomasii TaxID=179995 RepID=UPI000D88717D|nr:sigma-E factor regulatory protein RseB domain-containing protein [Anaerobiospirillum thomasii]SPT71087.1 Sigma-E factor regulatory protein rseB precursor [Anaerobiospirillum thomasii]
MRLILHTAGWLCALAVLLSINTAQAQDLHTKSKVYGADNKCNIIMAQTKSAYTSTDMQARMVVVNGNNMGIYFLQHNYADNKRYAMWESLDGEIQGYAMRDKDGFDYNVDRRYLGHLSWHPTQIWNRIFDQNPDFESFSCVMTGRTRLAGYRVTLIRLVPQDGLRYTYLIARDDDTEMPIELAILSPEGEVLTKITAIDFNTTQKPFPHDDNIFESYAGRPKSLETVKPWKELNLPADFKLIGYGSLKDDNDNETSVYQEFSDGITSFRVYKSPRISVLMPTVSNGTLNIFRKVSGDSEYAVVGEVSIKLSESVLSNLSP